MYLYVRRVYLKIRGQSVRFHRAKYVCMLRGGRIHKCTIIVDRRLRLFATSERQAVLRRFLDGRADGFHKNGVQPLFAQRRTLEALHRPNFPFHFLDLVVTHAIGALALSQVAFRACEQTRTSVVSFTRTPPTTSTRLPVPLSPLPLVLAPVHTNYVLVLPGAENEHRFKRLTATLGRERRFGYVAKVPG